MTVKDHFVSRAARRAGLSVNAPVWRHGFVPFALLALSLLLAPSAGRAQVIEFTGSNLVPLEGPGVGADTVLVQASGLPGNTTPVLVTTDADWITVLSTATGSYLMNVQNGPNRLRFQFAANTGATRSGHIVLSTIAGGLGVTITVTQAGAGFTPAGPIPIITAVTGPKAIDVDSQGNLYFTDVAGANLYEWTAATQTLGGVAARPNNSFVDVAVDAYGDVFALENTPDGNFGTQVEQIRATQGQNLPPDNIVFSSEADKYLFPMGLCVDSAGQNLNVTAVAVSNKCLIDQFGTVYELDTTDDNENLGSFAAPPTNAQYQYPPNGVTFFPLVTGVDTCGNQMTGVSGSLYGLSKDGSGFIYFLDQNGTRLNRYDPTTPWYKCTPPPSNGLTLVGTSYTSFTTVANLTYPAFYAAADTAGNIYLSEMAFSRIEEIPRAYVSSAGPFNEPVGGGTDSIQILPAAQTLTGVFAPVSSDTSWLNVTSAGNGLVTFSFSPNSGQSRSATITVLGVPIQVVQAESQVPAAMVIIAGNNQQAAIGGLPFATNLLVKVTNQWGDAVANLPVQFSSPSQQISTTTSTRGYASTTSMNAYASGPISVTASIPGTGISQTFALTGFPSGISVVSGSNQQAAIGGQFGAMTVQVFGTSGQPVLGVPVTFSAPTSGASGIFIGASIPANATTITVNTNGSGIASTSYSGVFQANTALGSYVVTASVSGVPGVTASSCVFNLTNFSLLQAGGNQTAFVNNAYASPLTLRVVDSNDNPVANAGVTFALGTLAGLNIQGAVFSDGTTSTYVVTGADGMATSLPMNASATAGAFIATAYVVFPSGGSLTTGWTLTNLPSTILEGALQNGVTTRTLTQPFIVKASANATAGTMVFTVVPGDTGAGGSFNGQTSVTVNLDSQGYGISPLLTANSKPGAFTVTAYDGVTTVQSTVTTLLCSNHYTGPSVVVYFNTDYNPQIPAQRVYGSLRWVLANACAGSNIDLSQIGSSTITLQSPLRIDDNMTLTGPTSSTLTIDGGSNTRLFFIGNGSVTMSNLTLQNGLAQGGVSVFGGGGAGMGGAIFMESGNVTLTNMTFKGNAAMGGGSGTAAQCTTNCIYGGGGFGGNAPTPEQGGSSGGLFGVPGFSNGASGGIGGGGAGTGVLSADTSANGGNGGFGAGGGAGRYEGGVSSSGNGGFGGGGAGGLYACSLYPGCSAQVNPGTGGYGAGNGYDPGPTTNLGFGGSGAGFGGAIFEYAGQLTLNGVQFLNNSAVGGTVAGLSGQPAVVGQGKGGALFIYNGAALINNGSTFGTNGTSNVAAAAGLPGNGNSAAPYTNGATCPGLDTVDVCGEFGNASAVTITVPAGFTFFIDGVSYTGSQTLNLAQGQYTLTAPGPQATGAGSQLVFASWSDGGAAAHTITVGPAGLSITCTFATQYLLSISAGPGGLAVPASGYYNAGSVVNLNAVPNVGSAFNNWTGAVAAAGSGATTVTMNAPQTVMANFAVAQMVNVTVPQGVSFTLNGATYTGPQFVSLAQGEEYTLSTTSPQLSATGGQEALFNSWSDGGAISHTFALGSFSLSITGSFSTQYQLIASAGSGGTISAANGFYPSGTVVNLTATPNAGYVFHNWTGMVASPSSATTTVTMSQAATVTANFWPAPSACLAAPANVAAWWKGDGSANDETTLYNATLGGDVSFAPGLVGQAFSFDGTQSPFVSVPAGVFPAQPGSGAFSFEAWFQTYGANGGVILGQQAVAPYGATQAGWSPAIYVGTDGNLYVEMFYNGGINQSVGAVPVNDNQWHHVAVTYDGSAEVAYLDGANIGQSLSFTQVPNGSPLSYQLGTGYTQGWPATNNGWYTFNGLIDEPTVYSRALAATEVIGIAQAGNYGKCDPVATLSPGTLSFAAPVLEGQTTTETAALWNPGNAPLAISAIAVDAGDTNFTVLSGNAQDCAVGMPVQPNASCTVRVQFSPQSAGTISGQVSITDNSVVDQGTQVISLVGSGQSLPPTVTFTGPSSAVYGSTFTPVVSTNSGAAASIIASGPCQVNGTVVTMTEGVGLCQLQASWPANVPFAAATATLSVNAAPAVVTATVTAANKTFDGTTAATVSSCTLGNVLPADAGSVTCSATSAAFSSPGVDNNIPVAVSGIALGGSAAANYQLSSTTATTTANIVFGSADSACIAPPAGVTAWWKGEGDPTDVTGAFGATLAGDVSFAPGKVGQAFSFDGSQGAYVLLPVGAFPAEPSNAPFTFETWFQTAGGNGGVILGEQSGVPFESNVPGWTPAIYVGTDGKLYAQMFYSSSVGVAQVVSSIPVNDNAWHHVAVTYDGTNEVVYMDAGAIGTIAGLVQAPNGPSLGYELGTGFTNNWPNGNNGWYTFNGLIDEATMYSRALTAGEVASIVQAANYGKCNPGASVSPGALTFNTTTTGQTATLSAVLSNPGNAPLTITSLAADAGDSNFSVLSGNAGDCVAGTPVQPNASCNIRVQFAPQAGGSLTGQVTITDNSLLRGGIQSIALSGGGLVSQTITFNAIPPQSLGTPLTLNATASSGLAVAFTSNLPVCTVSSNTATFLTSGPCSITASQSGNATYAPATPVTQTFNVLKTAGTTTKLVANPTTATQGDSVLLTATVSGNPVPTGTVTFSNGGTVLGTKTLNSSGVATLATTTLPLGTLSLAASYAGNAKDSPSTSGPVAVTITASVGAPTVISLTPNSGSSAARTFSSVYSDPNGAADLATVRLLFSSAVTAAHGCYVTYYPATNLMYLENDGGNAVSAGLAPGSAGSLSNSQCTLTGTGSSYSAAGNTATLNLALTFTSTLPENIYLYAAEANATASNTGWLKFGTWGASAGAPTVISVTPNAGSAAVQTFSAVYSDPNGAADLATVRLLFNTAVTGAHACYVTYYPATNLLYLENDGGTANLSGLAPGSAGSAFNSQCTLSGTGSSYSAAGNTATLNVALTFKSTLPTNIYLYASEANATGSVSGWIKLGTWGASAGPPTVVSVTPNAGSAAAQTFSAVYSDPNGAADLATVRLLFNSVVSGAHACYVTYYPATNLLYLENDGGTGTLPGVTPGSAGTASNSQCTLNGTGSSYSALGNTATLNVALTFTDTLPENVYLYATEANATASNSGWLKFGTWGASAGPPTVVSVTPNTGSAAAQTFTAVYSDPNGAADLATVRLLFNTAISGAHTCYVLYYPATNLLYLENDGGTATLAGIAPGSAGSASNSQCTLSGTGSSYSASGNTATLNAALTFTNTLPENIYLYAAEANATASNSGWLKFGTWGTSAGAPTVVSITPNAGSGASQKFSAVYSDPNGAADLATVRLLFNTSVSGAHACYVIYYPATNLLYLENDGGTANLPGLAPGSAASASNSQCTLSGTGSSYSAAGNTATLNVALTFTNTLPENIYLYAAEANATAGNSGWLKFGTWGASAGAPTVISVTPNSGSGAAQAFSAVYSDPNGAADLATVRLLFNSAVSGAHGCYVTYYPATNLLYLENDGGTGTLPGVTPGSAGTASNSRCTLAGTGSSYSASGNTATLNVALTFTNALPENIYLYAAEANATAGNSGWLKFGTWGASAGAPSE